MTAYITEQPTAAVLVFDHFEAIWRGEATGFGEEKIRQGLARDEQMLADLNAKRITPRKVVGPGVAKPLTTARAWLTGQIEQGKRDLVTRGRTNSVNIANVVYAMPADHPAKQHRVAVTPSSDYPHLFQIGCGCGSRRSGHAATSTYDAPRIEHHMVTGAPLR